MKKSDVINLIFPESIPSKPKRQGLAFAPTNIALCKYWGKRNSEINLPVTSSLSIALPDKGAYTTMTVHDAAEDTVVLNGQPLDSDSGFVKRTKQFLDLFRVDQSWRVHIDIKMNIPVAAGLASSACGFASLVSALNDLFDWQLSHKELSILARLGSGSASRSLWNGFVEWHAGVQTDGMDSFAEPLSFAWPEFCVGVLPISQQEKPISSREAMQRTVSTSMMYAQWPKKVAQDLVIIRQALHNQNFPLLGGTAESNAMNMHATMLSSWPPISYYLPETIAAMQQVWQLRKEGLDVYFTQDAGPNLKLLFLAKDKPAIQSTFPAVHISHVFEDVQH